MTKLGAKREIKQERAAKTRVDILQASIELFARRGILATTMNELAKAIKMTPGALYWHFPTKEDLLLAAMEELHQRFIGEFTEVLTEGRAWSAKRQLMAFLQRTRSFLRYQPQNGIFFAMLAAEAPNNNERIAGPLRDMLGLYIQVLAGICRYGQKKGEFRADFKPDAFAHALLSGHMGIIVHQQLAKDVVTYDGMCDALEVPLLAGLEARPAA
ncbi:MAG: TetR/AcrR family transcriptional regulator [Archangiaceae bacterium]|nr:TetR/AcrR family transcriptional regulator [Archangiaceae bacterium]